MKGLLLLTLASLVGLNNATGDFEFDYSNQTAWGDIPGSVCTIGVRQSPIDILTSELRDGDDLISLKLFGWDRDREGQFSNSKGRTVLFTPNSDEPDATTENHQGTYFIQQFHMHWGPTDNVGSEHRIDGNQVAAEIHFVHRRTSGPDDAGNAFAVVGVMAVADDDAELAGIWSSLDVSAVKEYDASTDVTVRYEDLLPIDLSYYYYEGGLTTPLCSELVQWFLLREPIKIPSAFLEQLRMVERTSSGEPLLNNYRDTQQLNGRSVMTYNSAAAVAKPIIWLVGLSLVAFFRL